jgi:AraC-like DNA-binding protein
MFYEPSTLASLTGLLATVLQQDYDTDPEPIFFRAGIPVMPRGSPKHRYPLSTIRKLWQISRETTGDETIGLRTGTYAKPPLFYAFGYSWMASSTLLGGLQRLERYYQSLSTASVIIRLTEHVDSYALSAEFPEESKAPPKEGIDCGMTALLALCDIVAEKEIRPLSVKLTCPATMHPEAYRQALRAPIEFNAPVGTFYFSRDVLLEPLRHGTPDIAKATDRIAEQYIESLDPHKVASHVRRLLIALLPAGNTDQEMVAKRLNRSASTLQRQLADEGLTYREVLESTRRSLAEHYLAAGKHSQAQIAYMLGFSDQSNFSRAFKRWTKMSPKQFQAVQAR